MKIIFKIARAELRSLFYSPIAWIIIVIFFVISGIQFVTPLREYAKIQELMQEGNPDYEGFKFGLTIKLFMDTVSQALTYLYLFLPLLTMGVISREKQAGTLSLLYSSPIRMRELVLGKYLGLAVFNLILLSSIALLLITGALSIQNVDWPIYVSMMLGFFLLSNAYLAIGLFVSCFSGYQIVAAIITFMVFMFLGFVHNLGQNYDLIRDVTYFLSFKDRVMYMIVGLITSKDLLYFVFIIIMFLGLALIKLKSTQESKKWTVAFSRNLLWVTIVLVLGYFSSRPGKVGYWDVTRNKTNTIDSAIQDVVKELDGSPVTVTLYTNLLDKKVLKGMPGGRNDYMWQLWEKYLRFYPNMQFKYEYYYMFDKWNEGIKLSFPNKNLEEAAALRAKMLDVNLKQFKKPEEIGKRIDLSDEPAQLLMELEYKGKKTILRTFTNPLWPAQRNVAAGIRRLVRDSIPKIVYTTGHFERSPFKYGEREFAAHTTYKQIYTNLINSGVDVDTISVLKADIAPETAVLVIADPKSAFDSLEKRRVLEFIEGGGNALFYAEPGKQSLLNPILQHIGIKLEEGVLMNFNSVFSPLDGSTLLNASGQSMAREEAMQLFMKGKGKGAGALFYGVTDLTFTEINGFKVEPILEFKGNDKVWMEKGYWSLDSAFATYSQTDGDVKKDKYVLGVKVSRIVNGKEQRIVVMGDADFMSLQKASGHNIALGLHSWLLNNEYPVYANAYPIIDNFVKIGKTTAKNIWYTYVYIIPGLLLLTGLVLIIRRSRK